ncbi:MAG: hypothetical protein ABDH66_07410 [Bacteroidia bacterium]
MRTFTYLALFLGWLIAQEERELPRGAEKPKSEPPQSIVLQGTVRERYHKRTLARCLCKGERYHLWHSLWARW